MAGHERAEHTKIAGAVAGLWKRIRAVFGGASAESSDPEPNRLNVAVEPGAEQPTPTEPPTAALCLSGGGSRALSAAFGQLSALQSLPDPQGERDSMLARFDHLSSVSGGSWASVIFTYAPESISDEQLLTTPVDPADLVKAGTQASPSNVEYLDPHAIGTAPQQFGKEAIAKAALKMFEWGLFDHRDRWSWFWIIAVGELILRPFGLYDATYDHSVDDPEPTKSFAPSEAWLTKNVLPNNPQLHAADFHLMRTGRAPLVVNTNIIEDKAVELPVQIPVQVEADWAGARGRSVDGTIGGGLVQSLGFTSTFASGAGPGRANVAVDRRYSLADIAGCSSAFFASEILHYLGVAIDDVVDELHKVGIPTSITDRLRTRLDDLLDADAEAIIPTYDYWQPQGAGSTPTTTSRGFSDGGDFDNTGVLGAIARTGATRLVVMLNSENGLEALPDKTTATVPGMLALLFGYRDERCKDGQPDPSGTWTKYGPRSPHEPLSYVQVFSDDEGEFADVQAQLLKNSSAGGSETGAATAWARQTLTTKQNDVAGIRGGRTVEVLWILNQKVHAWQDRITDPGLKDDLAAGQDHQDGPLKNFPLYNTGGQIDLSPEAVNMLAQLSAWNVQQLHDELGDLLG